MKRKLVLKKNKPFTSTKGEKFFKRKIKTVGKDVKKLRPSYNIYEKVQWYNQYVKQLVDSSEGYYLTQILLLGVHQREMKKFTKKLLHKCS